MEILAIGSVGAAEALIIALVVGLIVFITLFATMIFLVFRVNQQVKLLGKINEDLEILIVQGSYSERKTLESIGKTPQHEGTKGASQAPVISKQLESKAADSGERTTNLTALKASCSHCGKRFSVSEASVGKKAKCPKCEKRFLIEVQV